METRLSPLFFFLLIGIFISKLSAQQEDCVTSRREPGVCIGIRQCPRMIGILQQRPLREDDLQYLQRSQCSFDRSNPIVCCPSSPTPRPTSRPTPRVPTNNGNDDENPNVNLRSHPLFPSDCGTDTEERIVGGESTDIDEFPWMALLEYQKPNGITTACGGVLISKRYVLTAAHCLKGKDLPKTWTLSRVRLGEYDTNQNVDCIQRNGIRVCADPLVTIPIEEQIAHEDYIPASKDQRNDIALLRLSRDVNFTHYIKAICLPLDSNVGQLLDVAGWGKTETRSESNVKLKVKIPLVSNADCVRTYANAGLQLGDGQICAGSQKGKDSCRGDSGGPLMARALGANEDKPRWVSIGVVSFGPSPCGMAGWPGVYTKVHDFLPWILIFRSL